jgi:hypothetical protein
MDKSIPRTKWLEIDGDEFARDFEQCGFVIGHHLSGHPLFELPRLVELSKTLPAASVEYNAGDVPVSLDPGKTPYTGLSVEETIRRIEEARSWMVLKNVEQDQEYRHLLDQCLDEIEGHAAPLIPGMQRREGFIFITSPDSVTPFHLDPEHNFLLQIRGTKTMYQFTGDDRHVITEQQVEKSLSGQRNVPFSDEYQARAKEFVLVPGQGLSVPLMTPHWVKNGPKVSISFSITWRTDESLRREALRKVNGALRGIGVSPSPLGTAPLGDALKMAGYKTLASVKKVVTRGKR